MSLHTDLDIYKTAESLFEAALAMQKHVPREFRLVVGQRVSGLAADILLQVARANKAVGDAARLDRLALLAEHIEAVTVLLRVAHRVRAISTGTWAKTVELTTALGKQCTGWRKYTLGQASVAHADLFTSNAAPAA